jgi:hypothetical protein
MDKIDREYPNPTINSTMMLAEVEWTDEDGDRKVSVEWYCSSGSPVVQAGLLALASAGAVAADREPGDE